MSESYKTFTDTIMNMRRFLKKSGREISSELLDKLNHPERNMRIIHIAGTNGKGSCAVFIAYMLLKMGFTVGLFTSPHLIDFNERIKVGEGDEFTPISHNDVLRIGHKILDIKTDDEPTMFDIAFVMAILKFDEAKCDYVILETGLGGTYDSTNAISVVPKACLITSIGLDHTDVLGDTLEEIAQNKAGIIVRGSKVVLSDIASGAKSVINKRCEDLNIDKSDILDIRDIDYSPYTYIKTLSGYQKTNAKAAIATVMSLITGDRDNFFTAYMNYRKAGEEHCSNDCAKCTDIDSVCNVSFDEWIVLCINMALNTFHWPARLEMIGDNILMDAAHNEEGFRALSEYLAESYPNAQVYMLLGMLKDKDCMRCIDCVRDIVDTFLISDVDSNRAKDGKKLSRYISSLGHSARYIGDESDVAAYLYDIINGNDARDDILYVVTGSIYYIGNVKRLLWQLQQDRRRLKH